MRVWVVLFLLLTLIPSVSASIVQNQPNNFTLTTLGNIQVKTFWDGVNAYWYIIDPQGTILSYWTFPTVNSWKTTGGGSWQIENPISITSNSQGSTLWQNYTLDSGSRYYVKFQDMGAKIKMTWGINGSYNRNYRIDFMSNSVPSNKANLINLTKIFEFSDLVRYDWNDINGGYIVTSNVDANKNFNQYIEVGNAYNTLKWIDPTISGGASGKVVSNCGNQTNYTNCSVGSVNLSSAVSWTVNITSSTTRNLSTTRSGINTTNLSAAYYMDELSGTIVDSSDNGKNGTVTGTVTYNVTGKYNSGLGFGGGRVNLSGLNPYTNNKGWVRFWFMPYSSAFQIINCKSIDTATQIVCGFGAAYSSSSSNKLRFITSNKTDNSEDDLDSNTVFILNRGYWIDLTFDGITKTIYVNGIYDNSKTATQGVSGNTKNYYIGILTDGVNFPFSGRQDEYMISNRSPTASEVWEDYILRTEQMQVKSTVNNTWSGLWNGTANNPLSIPYSTAETATALQFNMTDNMTIDGILAYNSSRQMNFSLISTITIGENTTEISQAHSGGYQYYNLSWTPGGTYNYSILNLNLTSYTDTYRGTPTLANSTSRTISGSYPNYTINFTAPINGVISYHNLTITYNNAPTGSITNTTCEANNPCLVAYTASDTDGNTMNRSIIVNGTQNYGNSPITFNGFSIGNYTSKLWLNETDATVSGQNVSYSGWVNVTADITPPGTPILTNGTPTQTTLYLSSNYSADYFNYTWWQKENTTSIWLKWDVTSINNTTVTGITSCSQNDYFVQVYDASGNHANSSQITVQQACANPEYATIVTKLNTIINTQNNQTTIVSTPGFNSLQTIIILISTLYIIHRKTK